MVIDKNTTQMNTFSKGMNTDTSDAYLEEGSYRLANNLRYITNQEENSGELHMIEGATLLTAIPGATVLAATQLRDTGIVITSGAGNGDWQVYTINHDDNDSVTKIIDVDNEGQNRVVGHKISLVTRWEDEENKKLYIADGKGPIITIFLNKIGQLKRISQIIAYPEALFDVPKFCGLIDGNLESGMYEYSYQYYIKHGQQSQISPSTKLIPLHNGALTVNSSNRIQGYEQGVKTNKGIKIKIPTATILNQDFNRLIIYRIHYVEVGVPPIIEIVFDEDMPSTDDGWFEFLDTGKDALSVISLEEYNMISGIHIIPKTIESMTDYMFASNIQNDNPVYTDKLKTWQWNENYEFIVAKLVGDTCEDDGRIVVKGVNGFSNNVNVTVYNKNLQQVGTDHVDLSMFIDTPVDNNNTYMNPYVSYCLKSLRRGETYRYGIIFYDKYGNATAVKHLKDVQIPDTSKIPTFEYSDGELYVYPIGIRFNINIPQDSGIVAYEIVRCGKDLSNMSTITQCAISRPIYKVFDLGTADQSGTRPESKTNPLTPTGFITNMDCWFGYAHSWINIYDPRFAPLASIGQATWEATNSGLIESGSQGTIQGNHRVFQIISPEYSYMSETVKDMIQKNVLTIDPILYIHPCHNETCTVHFDESGQYSESSEIDITNIGNEYANVIIRQPGRATKSGNSKVLSINTFEQTMACYYLENKQGNRGNDNKLHMDFSGSSDFKERWGKDDPNRYEYIKLYNQTQIPIGKPDTIEITSTGFPDTLNWDDFATPVENWQLKYIDKVTGVGGRNFCNWICGGLYYAQRGEDIDQANFVNKEDEDRDWIHTLQDTNEAGGMMGPGGKCMVVAVNDDYLSKTPQNVVMGTFLCNIKQVGTGYNMDPKYSIYRSYGNYFRTSTADVFDGDCFIQSFEYISQHKWNHPYMSNRRDTMIAYAIPIETSINLAYTHGYELSKRKESAEGDITNIQVNPSNVNNAFVQDTPLYAYNSVYSANSTSKTLAAEDSQNDDYFDSQFDYRVFNSVAKSNDEYVDNWLKFLPANYLDVDTRYGEITGLRKFNNSLVFWQENAAGLLSVNERVQITDDTNMPLTLGTADVLSRYDYMNTSNGMRKDEYADTQSDTTLYWWDHNKHEILGYSGGTQVVSVSKAKFVQNFLNEMEAKGKLIDSPLLWHDKQFNEVGFTVSDGDYPKAGSLMFGENIGAFSSLYSVLPKAAITFKDSTLLLNSDGTIYKWNSITNEGVKGIKNEALTPYLKYVVNANAAYTKVFDNAEIAGRLYGGGNTRTFLDSNPLNNLQFVFSTPLKQEGQINGANIDNTEYNFRFAIPRNNDSPWGDRLRGKTMQAELMSASNSYDFSLQYIMTKYRISWT